MAQSPGPADYPPDHHILRDLALDVDHDGDVGVAALDVSDWLLDESGSVRLGVLAILVDVSGAMPVLRAAHPGWGATADLTLQRIGSAHKGRVEARASLVRAGRTAAVVEVEVSGTDGPVALSTLTFTILQPRDDTPERHRLLEDRPLQHRSGDVGLTRPLLDELAVDGLGDGAGEIEVPLAPYISNSLGGVQGGVVAMLAEIAGADAASGATGEPMVVTDLSMHFLSLGRVGPIRSSSRVLRADPLLVRLSLLDQGRGREMARASVGCVPAASLR